MTSLTEVVRFMDAELRTAVVPDYDGALNGLQLANGGKVSQLAAAVDFSAQTVAAAIAKRADLLLVHHGMFWGGPKPLVGVAFERVRTAIDAGLAVYASHIPLDLHPTLGNNALLAKELQLEADSSFGDFRGVMIGVSGSCDIETAQLADRVRSYSSRFGTALVTTPIEKGRRTKRWAIVTGAGANSTYLAEAYSRGVDTLIVGEGSHHTAVDAMQNGLTVLYAGHYATETLGVQALAKHVAARFGLKSVFVDVPTGL